VLVKNLFDVSGKIAVVTGGSSGIGAMMARGLLENGAKVYITARKVPQLEAAAKELSAFGVCHAIPSDLSSIEGIEGFVSEFSKHEKQIDILINNAGAVWAAPFDQFPEQGWDKIMDINIKSMFFMTQKCLPLLKVGGTAEDPARVINIASINGIRNSGMVTYSYTASKAAAVHLTTHLGVDLAPFNINVNGIAPGFFPSKMTKAAVEDDNISKMTIARIPRKRMGTPEDIAGTAIYLSSRASAWVCGEMIVLDGGMISTA
jgi:NAD(P)-dependent dehydrogenase (short-subunit alcohol dehydrogenase family)